jgi:hypothetical protein
LSDALSKGLSLRDVPWSTEIVDWVERRSADL